MKKIILCLFSILLLFTGMMKASAAQANISVNASTSQVIVGNEVTVTVTISSGAPLGAWEYTLNYDQSVFRLTKYDVALHFAGYSNNANTKTVSYKYVFKALKSGSSNFYTTASSVVGFDENVMGVVDGSRKISAITYAEYQESLSKNNNLASLGIEGNEVTPEFNKDTLEYSAKVSEDTKEINIIAKAEDNAATVTGDGKMEVTAGNNVFKIIVIAENGAEKTYTLNVEVVDKNPINVEVDGKKYTVVKIRDNLTAPNSFKESTVQIGEYEIPAYYSDIMKFTVVGLKNENGDISLFIYEDGKYEPYIELVYGNITIYPLAMKEEIKGYTKGSIKLKNSNIECLETSKDSRYKLIYAKNVETNEEGLFLFDNKDHTVIKYDEEGQSLVDKKIMMLTYSTFAFVGSTILAFIALICILSKKKKKVKKEKIDKKEIIKKGTPLKEGSKKGEVQEDLSKTKKIDIDEFTKTKAIKKDDLAKTRKIEVPNKENVNKDEALSKTKTLAKTTSVNKLEKTRKINISSEPSLEDDSDEVYDIFSDDRKKKKKKKKVK